MTIKTQEVFNVYSHLAGALLALAGLVFILRVADASTPALITALAYGLSMVFLFSASALYHAFKKEENEVSFWRKMDRLAIFFMIAGTYTPICYFYLEGAAYHYERIVKKDRPAWDTYVIASPRGALLFVLDLEYKADLDSKVFSFGEPRHDTIPFPLPAYLRAPNQVLHIDADTVEPVSFQAVDGGVILQRAFRDVDIFAVSRDKQLEPKLRSRLRELIDPTDLETLRALLR